MNLLPSKWPGLESLPYVALAELPTPVEQPAGLLADATSGAPSFPVRALVVKRDDLTSPLYGGNKVRKLEFLLGDAVEKGARSVITFGAYGSNHALATAVHAREVGIEPHVVLSPQPATRNGAATVLAHAGLGTGIVCAESSYDAMRSAAELRAELRERDGVEPYVIPMGGSSPVGILGYVNAAVELMEWVASGEHTLFHLGSLFAMTSSELPDPDAIYVAAGTLGTAVGLAVGLAALEPRWAQIEAVRVTPIEIASEDLARAYVRETVELLRSHDESFPALDFSDLRLNLRDDQYGAGYAVPTDAATEAVALAAEVGLSLETTYTGKALAALVADGRAGLLRQKHALFWDTYSSVPKPAAGDVDALPVQLQEWVRECERSV